MNILKSTKPKRLRYLDVESELTVHYFNKSKTGLRIVVTHDLQGDTAVVKLIKGDGRTIGFRQYAHKIVAATGIDEAVRLCAFLADSIQD